MYLSDVNQNVLTSQITVLGAGTIANIYLDQQIFNINDQNSGTSSFQATYNDGKTYNHNYVITQTGAFSQHNNIGPVPQLNSIGTPVPNPPIFFLTLFLKIQRFFNFIF
jgi:hypothetical protein